MKNNGDSATLLIQIETVCNRETHEFGIEVYLYINKTLNINNITNMFVQNKAGYNSLIIET